MQRLYVKVMRTALPTSHLIVHAHDPLVQRGAPCASTQVQSQNSYSTSCSTPQKGPLWPTAAHAMGSCGAPGEPRATQTAASTRLLSLLIGPLIGAPGGGPSPKYEYAPRSTARSRRDVAMSSSGVPY